MTIDDKLVHFTAQPDGNFAVNFGGFFIGIIGRDERGRWWASYSSGRRRRGGGGMTVTIGAAMLSVNGLRSRRAAVEQLINFQPLAQFVAPASATPTLPQKGSPK
jgi:hypothetical protein